MIFLKSSFFPSTIKEWKNLEPKMRKCKSISIFKINILKSIRPKPNNVYCCHNPKGIRLKTRLRLGCSHLCEHKLKHSFQNCLNSLCLCCNDIETSTHYLPHGPTLWACNFIVSDWRSETKGFGLSLAASYMQRWALCSNRPANLRVSVKWVEVVEVS